jgi:hypothetical protein
MCCKRRESGILSPFCMDALSPLVQFVVEKWRRAEIMMYVGPAQ